jgi:hypothetical protein
MITLTITTRTLIEVEEQCKEEVTHTRLGIDRGAQVWVTCPCCAGGGAHPYGADGYMCMACRGNGKYELEEPDTPATGWPCQN